MGEVKGQGHIADPVSNRCTSFQFHIDNENQSYMSKTYPKFSNKISQKHIFSTEFLQNITTW